MTSYLLAGGGTAGHVNPLLAVAAEIRRRDPHAEIIFIGTREGLESRLVPAAGFAIEYIARLPFPRRPDARAWRFIRGWRRTVDRVEAVIHKHNVDVVFGVGGYVAAPVYAAARRLGRPLVIHEANARPGLANKWAARFARGVGFAVRGTKIGGGVWVGMPLRSSISTLSVTSRRAEARASFGLDPKRPVLLVTGGSLGARRINTVVSATAQQILGAGWQILHITGSRDDGIVEPAGGGHVVMPYCDRMDDALAAASFAISRAGSSTVAELSALGVPALLVPYASGNGEQALNARPLAAAGGCRLIDDKHFTNEWVSAHLLPLLLNPTELDRMAAASAREGTRDGTARTVDLIGEALGATARLST
ncbi:MAG: UDP-N-acetylglucosamine--N-acetylmuramyl-(pentapeptide) pyrophosphoryl-undecaprenol N-acetylglucosamine transferase [Actinobacteria bacterium]|uniref:Unannotated protein n=1 Tax=freshwater metagenome TaxID=449393 RepID=A0A6J7G5G6_9ZZZZ|nr:UDP-N-acetylglucosamine--N-acetylmuramyl-(pentapeptide) pyrophosphoryl-undecaprenol N-acetylglucosamine transferase [Actinomycetota bacterium]